MSPVSWKADHPIEVVAAESSTDTKFVLYSKARYLIVDKSVAFRISTDVNDVIRENARSSMTSRFVALEKSTEVTEVQALKAVAFMILTVESTTIMPAVPQHGTLDTSYVHVEWLL